VIVKEKGLLRQMKEAWKGSGYTVMVDEINREDYLCISYWGWKVGIAWDTVPRKVVGLLAEHIGRLPALGEAFKVQKDEVQRELFDTAKGPFEDLWQCIEHWEHHKIMKATKLEWGGSRVWQSPRDQTIVLLDPELGGIACFSDASMDVRLEGSQLMIRGNRSFASVGKGFVNDGDKQLLEHLTNMQWVQ
jgi:hypothetical protein